MLREDSMMERWFFYQDGAGLWKWARLDVLGTVLGHSGSSFETRDACVDHALLNGYTEERAARLKARASGAQRTEGHLPRFTSVTSFPPKQWSD
jgi:hypothetical protein